MNIEQQLLVNDVRICLESMRSGTGVPKREMASVRMAIPVIASHRPASAILFAIQNIGNDEYHPDERLLSNAIAFCEKIVNDAREDVENDMARRLGW
jgi:hypothetical protein